MDNNEERVISVKETKGDKAFDLTLRPQCMKEYVGQEKIKENLYSYNADFNITSTLPYLDGKFFIQGEPSFDTVE